MKNFVKRLYALFCIGSMITCMLTGCTKNNRQETEEKIEFDMLHSMSDQGMLMWSGEFIYFVSYETGEKVPVCNKPGCLHDQLPEAERENCLAYYGNIVGSAFIYQDHIYVISFPTANQTTIYESSLDGTNRHKFITLPFELDSSDYLFYNGKLFINAREYEYEVVGVPSVEATYYVVELDLESKITRVLSDKWHDYGGIQLIQTDGEKLWFSVTCCDEPLSSENLDRFGAEMLYLEVNLSTGSITPFAETGKISMYMCSGMDFYYLTKKDEGYDLFVKRNFDGDDTYIRSITKPGIYPINGEVILREDLDDWRKDVYPGLQHGEYILVVDFSENPEGGREAIMKADDYLAGVKNMTYIHMGTYDIDTDK